MNQLLKKLILTSILSLTGCSSTPKNPWEAIELPTSGAPQALGSYERGCLSGAIILPENTPGLQLMRPGRRRFYGHPELIHFLEELGKKVQITLLNTLLVGDLSNPRGGPHMTGHKSHQTGLDVDIWFLNPGIEKNLTLEERESLAAPSVLSNSGEILDPTYWTQTQRDILKTVATFPIVERIFVTPLIKKDLCQHFQSDSKQKIWLRKIRPWWGHVDHFHVRLNCPKDNLHCKPQAPVGTGNGCDSSLDWWFSNEAKQPAQDKKESEMPLLPPECETVLLEK